MEEIRYEKGVQVIENYMGTEMGHLAMNQMKELNINFANIIIPLFGEFYSRDCLDKKQKALVTLTTLITSRSWDQLRLHTHNARIQGLEKDEIYEVVFQCIPYVGIPTATDALKVITEVLES